MLYIVWYDLSHFKANKHFTGAEKKAVLSLVGWKRLTDSSEVDQKTTDSRQNDKVTSMTMSEELVGDLKHSRCGCDSVQGDSVVSAVHGCVVKICEALCMRLCTGMLWFVFESDSYLQHSHSSSSHFICLPWAEFQGLILILQFCILIRDSMKPQPKYTV